MYMYLRRQKHVSTNFKKIGCSFAAENKSFEKSKMTASQDGRHEHEMAVAIASVVNQNLIKLLL